MASGGLILYPTISNASSSSLITKSSVSHQADIRQKLFGKQVEITGQIFDTTGKNILSGAKVEFWHLSPESYEYNHRSALVTDANGNFKILTDFPNREIGKQVTIHFKVSKDINEAVTELKISDFGAYITDKHWETNRNLADNLLFPKIEKSLYKTKINFNISINQ